MTDPLTHVTGYTYDEVGDLLSILDANNHTTGFAYDALNRQTQKTWPDTSYETFGYDLNDNLTSHRLADGHTNTFGYDDLNRLNQINYFDGASTSFTYTANGLRQTAVDGRGTTHYDYDHRDRLTQITQPNGQVVAYTYDAAGNRLSLTSPAGGTGYTYDDANQLASVTGPQGGASTYIYDAAGLRKHLNLPNGVTVDYDYDTLNRLANINQHKGATTLASYAYLLDPAGNRLSVTEADGASIHWTYDDAYRLSSETRRDSSNAITYQAGFNYDPVGNRLTQTVNGATTNYNYNNLDQLQTAGTAQYQYDGRGNLTQITDGSNVTTYSYDAADRLAGVTLPDSTAISYGYDADGRRVKQTAGSQVANYLWDEASAYDAVVLETNGSGSTLASYVLGGTDLISQTRGGTTSYYLQDGQGSTRALTNSAGAVTDTYSYSAFGELLGSTGTTANPYLYTRQQFDTLTGLYDLRARYYDPVVGRFLSQDTYPFDLGNPVEGNRYAYSANDPIDLLDPTGNQAFFEYAINLAKKGAIAGALYGVGNTLFCDGNLIGNVLLGALYGTGFRLAFGLGAAISPVATSIAGIGLGVYFTGSAVGDALMHGWGRCNTFNAVVSLLGIAWSGRSLVKAWNPPEQINIGRAMLDALYNLSRPGHGENVKEVVGQNALDWFYRIVDPGTVKPHPNPLRAAEGALQGKVPGGGRIFYRPITSSPNPALEIKDVPGYPIDWKFHFPDK